MISQSTDPAVTEPSPPWAVFSIILSMGFLAVGNGMLFAYIPVRLASEGFEPWVSGAMITAMAAGGFAGCLATGPLVRRVGHARAFACLAAIVSLTYLLIALGTNPVLWVISRALYGVSGTGVFIVSQSWLNDAADNRWRGRIIALFYMFYVICIGLGSWMLNVIDISTLEGPLISIFFATLAILPIGFTRLRAPTPPEYVSIALRSVWRISPVGLVGMFTVGGLTMLVQGFAPIFAANEGYPQSDIGNMMFLMQFGMLGVQLPLGALSDRTDRRLVLVATCLIVVGSAVYASRLDGAGLILLIIVFGVWAGATETIYSVANAHANDRAEPQYYVSLSSTMLVAWSVSGFVIPGAATALTPVLGPRAFMYVAAAIALAYGLFVVLRIFSREAVPEDETVDHQQVSAQAPLTAELSPLYPEDEEDTGDNQKN